MCSSTAVLVAGVQGGSQPPCLAGCCILQPICSVWFAGGGPGGQSAPLPHVQELQQQQHSSGGQWWRGPGGQLAPLPCSFKCYCNQSRKDVGLHRRRVVFTWQFNFPSLRPLRCAFRGHTADRNDFVALLAIDVWMYLTNAVLQS
jgi:hypothetical protein